MTLDKPAHFYADILRGVELARHRFDPNEPGYPPLVEASLARLSEILEEPSKPYSAADVTDHALVVLTALRESDDLMQRYPAKSRDNKAFEYDIERVQEILEPTIRLPRTADDAFDLWDMMAEEPLPEEYGDDVYWDDAGFVHSYANRLRATLLRFDLPEALDETYLMLNSALDYASVDGLPLYHLSRAQSVRDDLRAGMDELETHGIAHLHAYLAPLEAYFSRILDERFPAMLQQDMPPNPAPSSESGPNPGLEPRLWETIAPVIAGLLMLFASHSTIV